MLILASESPRRRALLAQLGVEFRVEVAAVDERRLPDESPAAMATRLALLKARTVAARLGVGDGGISRHPRVLLSGGDGDDVGDGDSDGADINPRHPRVLLSGGDDDGVGDGDSDGADINPRHPRNPLPRHPRSPHPRHPRSPHPRHPRVLLSGGGDGDDSGDTTAVLAGDTVVALGGESLGKPASRAHAVAMLQRLSGATHTVYSAVALVAGNHEAQRLSATRVTFAPLTARDIEAYCDTGEPYDKAGAYGIQGPAGAFVTRIEGSYSGVVGLPLWETRELLNQMAEDG